MGHVDRVGERHRPVPPQRPADAGALDPGAGRRAGRPGRHAVGVYEIVYWVGGKPDYQWQYVNAGTTGAAAAGGGNLYCSY